MISFLSETTEVRLSQTIKDQAEALEYDPVKIDPSYKQYDYLQGLDVLQISGIDPEQLAQSFIDSGTINEDENWVTDFDPTLLQAAQTQAQQQLETYIENNLTDPTVGDVIGGRKTIIKAYPTLPSSLPNKIITTGSRYALPTNRVGPR